MQIDLSHLFNNVSIFDQFTRQKILRMQLKLMQNIEIIETPT